MNKYILLIISMLACLFGGMLKKVFTNRFPNNPLAEQVFNLVTFTSAAIVLICWGGFSNLSWFTLLLSLAFGIITALQQLSSLKAMNCGPWSYTSVITALSTLIPALSGVLFWHESLHYAQIVGIILMVVCFLLSVDTKKGQKNASIKWLLWCFAVFICTGLIGVMQKWHQSSDYKGELNSFLIIAFLSSSAYSLACCIGLKRKLPENLSFIDAFFSEKTAHNEKLTVAKQLIPTVTIMLLVGVSVAINNKLNLHLSGIIDSAVFFPIVNGGGLVLTTVASAALFREKLSLKQWIGLFVGIVSVIFLANPFG